MHLKFNLLKITICTMVNTVQRFSRFEYLIPELIIMFVLYLYAYRVLCDVRDAFVA